MKKDNFTKEELEEFYLNHSYTETLQHFGITGGILDRRIKKYGIVKESKSTQNAKSVTSEELRRFYIEENHSKKETQEHFGLTNWRLSILLKNFGIEKDWKSKVELSASTREIRYGDPHYNNREKFAETCVGRYGGIGFASSTGAKSRQTTLERYGAENIRKSEIYKERVRRIKLERYGDENYTNLEKRKETCLERYGEEYYLNICPKKHSGPEKRVRELLGGHLYRIQNREFDIKVGNVLVEVDGEFWHPDTVQDLTPTQVRNLVNDYYKEKLAKEAGFELIHVHVRDIPEKDEDVTVENLRKVNYRPSYKLGYSDMIIFPEKLNHILTKYGKDYLEQIYLDDMVDLLYLCQPVFPEIGKEEDLQETIQKLSKIRPTYREQHGYFSFKSGTIGNNVLKSRFRSFWEAANRGRLSPVEAWENRDLMKNLIRYRVGINDTGEVYGLGIKTVLRGMNVNRFLVSFFPPSLAAQIYRYYLGDIKAPVVFDPSMGFGARLLGFKSQYPEGTYIGCEPNERTFKELEALVQEAGFTNVHLYNCKLEDLKQIPEYDLGFTSPPYFDIEDYKNGVEYRNFEEWKELFWNKLVSLPNMYLNINEGLYNQLSDPNLKIVDRIIKGANPVGSPVSGQELIIKSEE